MEMTTKINENIFKNSYFNRDNHEKIYKKINYNNGNSFNE